MSAFTTFVLSFTILKFVCEEPIGMKQNIGSDNASVMRKFLIALMLIMVIATAGCSIAYRTLLGVKTKLKWQSNEKIIKDFERKNIPFDQAFVLDTASYYRAIVARWNAVKDSASQTEKVLSHSDSLSLKRIARTAKDNLQPVQIRYFTADGNAIFKLVNCYIDPPIPMRWNIEGAFDTFPPRPISQLKDVVDDSLTFFLPHLWTLDGNSVSLAQLPEADYYAVIFFNEYMIRPSKRLLKEVRKYHKRHPDINVHVMYVNNHNAQLWPHLGPEDKEKVKELEGSKQEASLQVN